MKKLFMAAAISWLSSYVLPAGAAVDRSQVDELSASIEPKVIAWRREIHEHPELSNRETRTAKLVAQQLGRLGLEVQTGVAHTASCRVPERWPSRTNSCAPRRHGCAASD
jgi:hypothetical protein